jgi:hypothetical protein
MYFQNTTGVTASILKKNKIQWFGVTLEWFMFDITYKCMLLELC